jgi:hypothetical protein
MDIAFLSGLFPSELENDIIKNSIGRVDYAANNLQTSFVNGLDRCNSEPIKIFNSLYIGSYPIGYKKIFIKTTFFSHKHQSKDINIGFINLPVIRELHKSFSTFLKLNKWSKENDQNKKVLLVYGVYTPFLLSAFFIKLFNKNIKTCLIVPDLPEYMSDSKSIFRIFFKFINQLVINKLLSFVDSFVLLSDFVADKLYIKNRPWVRIEGIYNDNICFLDNTISKNDLKIIMYCGNLDKTQGIIELLNAFSTILESNYRLWFTGSGDALSEIVNRINFDSRISYFGKLSKNELLQKQSQCTLLINPLGEDHPKVKYFFPSKTMEYLASGKPTLMHKLPCIPLEYHPYLFFFTSDTLDAMRELIVEVCNTSESELSKLGAKAKEFIANEKNPVSQCSKLYNMLLNI